MRWRRSYWLGLWIFYRYDAEIQLMLGSLPTYTQLGMASLLPNRDMRIADNDTSAVIVDGQSSQGTENRRKTG